MTEKTDTIWNDLRSWQGVINEKDNRLASQKPVKSQPLPPVRPSVDINLDTAQPKGLGHWNTMKPTTPPTPSKQSANMTLSQKAQAEKEKGNVCFQNQRFEEAVAHYGKAIELDPTVAVYFINRAMANLKLKRFLQAEQDCSQGLRLQPQNVKALWRRGMARRELGRIEEARLDFNNALAIEPNNKAVQEELAKLPAPKARASQTSKPSVPSTTTATEPKTTSSQPKAAPAKSTTKANDRDAAKIEPPQKRRLPIKVVDEAYVKTPKAESSGQSPAAKPEQPASPSPATQSPPPPATPAPAPAVSLQTPLSPISIKCPRTNLEFQRDWKACKHRGPDTLREYFECIPPSQYATLFRSSLESDQLEQMIEIIRDHFMRNKTDAEIYNVMKGLSRVQRLDMLAMFLGETHVEALKQIFKRLKPSMDAGDLASVAKAFRVRLSDL